jgi:hypothetical protein
MDANFNIMTEESVYNFPTATLSEETWSETFDFSPLVTETQDEAILAAGGFIPPPIEPNPIGNALCPLLLLATFYFSFVYLKVMKKKKAKSAIRK